MPAISSPRDTLKAPDHNILRSRSFSEPSRRKSRFLSSNDGDFLSRWKSQADAEYVNKKDKFEFKICKHLSTQFGLLIVLLGYSCIGAVIFQALERPNELRMQENTTLIKNDLLTNVTYTRNELLNFFSQSISRKKRRNFTILFEEMLIKYQEELEKSMVYTIEAGGDDPPMWDYWGALFFCATVYTTIGYGHIAPSTTAGRIVSMLYATIGIPLFLVVMAHFGQLLTRFIKFWWSCVRELYYVSTLRRFRHTLRIKMIQKRHGSAQINELKFMNSYARFKIDDNFNINPIVAILITFIYIFLGALIYIQWEPWTYLEAFYFIFVSVSTIGFGDVLPTHAKYFISSFAYLLLGLSLVAMVVNVIKEYFYEKLERKESTKESSVFSRYQLRRDKRKSSNIFAKSFRRLPTDDDKLGQPKIVVSQHGDEITT